MSPVIWLTAKLAVRLLLFAESKKTHGVMFCRAPGEWRMAKRVFTVRYCAVQSLLCAVHGKTFAVCLIPESGTTTRTEHKSYHSTRKLGNSNIVNCLHLCYTCLKQAAVVG